jgi:hypothetical protein
VGSDDGELSGGDEVFEDLLDAAATEAGVFLEGGLVDGPLAVLVGVAGDDEEDQEVRASPAGVLEDGGQVLKAQGWLRAWSASRGEGRLGGTWQS